MSAIKDCPPEILACTWHEAILYLRAERTPPAHAQSLLFTLRAILKSIPWSEPPRPHIAFRVRGVNLHQYRPLVGESMSVELCFVGATEHALTRWLASVAGPQGNNYTVLHTGLRRVLAADMLARYPHPGGELALDFDTLVTLDTRHREGEPPAPARLLQMLAAHVSHVFGLDLPVPDTSSIRLLAQSLQHQADGAPSQSEPGSVQRLDGWVGRVYLQGALAAWLPWLVLAQAVNATKYAKINGLGSFRLQCPPPPLYEDRLLDAQALNQSCADVCAGSGFNARQSAELLEEVTTAIQSLRERTFKADPTQAISIPKPGREELREIERLTPRDRVLVQHLRVLLEPDLEKLLSHSAHAYRCEHSVHTALAAARLAVSQGRHWVIKTDIEQFFPSVRHELLFDALDGLIPQADQMLRTLLYAMVSAPLRRGHTELPRWRGLAQGSPLSPMLANFYLARIDRSINDAGACLVRYADDMLILAHEPEQLQVILLHLKLALTAMGLKLDEDKTCVCQVDEAGIGFLGQRLQLGSDGLVVQPVQPPDRRALVLTRPSLYVQLQGEAIEIRERGELLNTLPLRGISCILALGHASFSQHLLERAARSGVPVVLRSSWQRKAVTVASLHARALAHYAQHHARHSALTEAQHLAIARAIVDAKILNKAHLIGQERRKGSARMAHRLRIFAEAAASCDNVASLRGIEGSAAVLAFEHLRQRLADKGISFGARDHEATDRVNVTLNFGYHLLATHLSALLSGLSLNPYLGHFHDSVQSYEFLVYDLMEPFRAWVDKLVINQFLGGRLAGDAWTPQNDRERMLPDARRSFVLAFETMLQQRLDSATLIQWMEQQVVAHEAHVLHEKPIWVWQLGQPPEGPSRT